MNKPIGAVGTVLLIVGCGPANPTMETSVQTSEFEAWLTKQCPDRRSLRLEEGSERVAVSCEELRATILGDEDRVVEAQRLFEEFPSKPATASGREPIGEAQERFSPVGAACSLITLGLGLIFSWPFGNSHTGCDTPGAHNPGACKAVTQGGAIGLGIACWFI
jgi:hypothetical protein